MLSTTLLAFQTLAQQPQSGLSGSISNVVEKKIDYWFVSGNHARSFISRTTAGDLIELPITWYAEKGGNWAMSTAYDFPQHAGFSRKITLTPRARAAPVQPSKPSLSIRQSSTRNCKWKSVFSATWKLPTPRCLRH